MSGEHSRLSRAYKGTRDEADLPELLSKFAGAPVELISGRLQRAALSAVSSFKP